MVLEGSGRVLTTDPSRLLIYISRSVADDSAFPFKRGDAVKVEVDPEAGTVILRIAD